MNRPDMNSTSQALYETLKQGLSDIDARGLRRRRKTIDGACSAHMSVDGREIIGFASNDYLGLAAHDAIRAALAEGASLYGAGSGGSRTMRCARRISSMSARSAKRRACRARSSRTMRTSSMRTSSNGSCSARGRISSRRRRRRPSRMRCQKASKSSRARKAIGDARISRRSSKPRAMLAHTRWMPVDSHTAVQPLVIGGNDETLAIAVALDRHGLRCPRSARRPFRQAPRVCVFRFRPRTARTISRASITL